MNRLPRRRSSSPSMAKLGRKLDHLIQTTDHEHDLLHNILERIIEMSAGMDRLTTEVAEASTVIDSAIALIEGLAQQIRDLPTNEAAHNALADELDRKVTSLSSAVVAGTPSEEVPPEEPPVEPEPPVE